MEDRTMWELINEIGTKLGRPKEEINALSQLLSENWITHLFHWKALPPEKRRLFNLPILLEHELETLINPGEATGGIKRQHPEPPSDQRQNETGAEEPQTKKFKSANEEPELDLNDDPSLSGRIELLLNPQYITKEFLSETRISYKAEGKPFPHCFLPNCLNDEFLAKVKEEILELNYKRKSNDLYDFWQTDDLKGATTPALVKLKQLLYGQEFRTWLQMITGIEDLNDNVDIFAARYSDSCTLLCHDDELEGRRIAYILYLVPKEWETKDGGSLDLFSVNENGEPVQIAESFTPSWNSFLFFEVNPVSFHQVSEVLTSDKERISISGWFHGPPIQRPPPYQEPGPPYFYPKPYFELIPEVQLATTITTTITTTTTTTTTTSLPQGYSLLEEWINPMYLEKANIEDACKYFEDESNIEFPEFLKEEKYMALMDSMDEQEWAYYGPVNRRHYERLQGDGAGIVKEFRALFHSQEFRDFLKQITNLDLIMYTDQVRCFKPGTYTLVQDQVVDEIALDAIYCCPTNEIPVEHGGQLVYMDEKEELLSAPPKPNTLCLIYRDRGTQRFVKYMNNHASDIRYDFAAVWKEAEGTATHQNDDEEEEEEGKGKEKEN